MAAGEQRQEIWATSFGALRWSLEEELRLAGKELTAVGAPRGLRAPPPPLLWLPRASLPAPQLRRAALDRLLQDERRQQQRELRRCGKAFHAERL